MASEIKQLVADVTTSEEGVAALYFDAKMRTAAFPLAILQSRFVAAPPGLGQDPHATVELLEPTINARHPEWVSNPDSIPKPLRDARIRGGNRRNDLLEVDPQDAFNGFRQRVVIAARAIARALDQSTLEVTLGNAFAAANEQTFVLAIDLLKPDTVEIAVRAEQAKADAESRSSAEIRLAEERGQTQDVDLRGEPGTDLGPAGAGDGVVLF